MERCIKYCRSAPVPVEATHDFPRLTELAAAIFRALRHRQRVKIEGGK